MRSCLLHGVHDNMTCESLLSCQRGRFDRLLLCGCFFRVRSLISLQIAEAAGVDALTASQAPRIRPRHALLLRPRACWNGGKEIEFSDS